MSQAILHLIYDPYCGWCYAAAPLAAAASAIPGLTLSLHGGGMLAGQARQQVTAGLRNYVMVHDQRIAQLTGQPFGDAYFNGLLHDTSALLDSEPPIAAILAFERLGGHGLGMLERLQKAHYVEGRRIAEPAVLVELAASLGTDAARFAQALDEVTGEAVQTHIDDSRRLMSALGARGFPAFALEVDGHLRLLDIGAFLGKPQSFADWLQRQLSTGVNSMGRSGFVCTPDSCAIEEKV